MSMEMSARDKKLLIYLIAVVILALDYFFVVKPFLDKNDALQSKITTLQQEVNELTDIYNHQDEYEANISEEHDKVDAALEKFPGGITQENTLMMLQGIEDDTDTWISRVSFTEVQYLSTGSGSSEESGSEEAVSNEDSEIAEDIGEGGGRGSEESEEEAVSAENLSASSMSTLRQDLSLDYSARYDDFKGFIDYIENFDSRLFISTLNASYSPEANEVSGTLTLSQYAVEGAGKKLERPDLSHVTLGVENIFTTLKGTTGSGYASFGEVTDEEGEGEEEDSEEGEEGEESGEDEEPEEDGGGARS